MMLLITHLHCLVPQKGRGWLIKHWQMFDLILGSFSKDYYGPGMAWTSISNKNVHMKTKNFF